VGTDSDRLPHTGVTHYDDKATVRVPAAALSNPDADLLARELAHGKTTLHLSLDVGDRGEGESVNVIGELRGSQKPDEIVLLGGHLDSWDLGTGAIDDGAGVSIVASAAHLIGQLPKRPKRSIRVVMFANEESGLFGAKAYAQLHKDEVGKHLIGAESDFGAGAIYQLDSAVPAERLATVDDLMPLLQPLGLVRGENDSGGGPDMIPMHELGMPVAELKQDGTDYFDYHHTANDTLDKIDPKNMDQNVAAYAVFAYLMAQQP